MLPGPDLSLMAANEISILFVSLFSGTIICQEQSLHSLEH